MRHASSRVGAAVSAVGSSTNAADGVHASLRQAIVEGRLEPGEALIEEHVARQFGISRTPVREALLRLESEGLATRVPRRGLVVRALSVHELFEAYAVRTELEGLAGRWAAQHAQPPEIAQLRWTNQRLREAMQRGETAVIPALTNEFHQGLASAAHNGLLKRFIMQMQDWTRQYGTSTVALPSRTATAIEEHERLVEAIEAHDAERAERLARAHIAAGRQLQLDTLRSRHRVQED